MGHEKAAESRTRLKQEIEMQTATETIDLLPVTLKSSCSSVCAFSKQDNSIVQLKERSKAVKKLCGLIVFYLLVMVVEIIGGLKSNSLAVMTDAAHLLSDVAGFFVSLFAVWASGWEATSHHSFGYGRFEVLGALVSVQLIWAISGFLIYEAIGRILDKKSMVNGGLMFGTAAFGFLINLIMVLWIGHDHSHRSCAHHHHACENSDHNHEKDDIFMLIEEDDNAILVKETPPSNNVLNINLQGAYLHVLVDMIQSFGVMIAGALIWAKPNWFVADLICTLLFSVVSLSTTISLLKNVFVILMERTPSHIDVAKLENGIKCIKGVQDIHDLHVWDITVGKTVLSCHVAAEPGRDSRDLLSTIGDYCEKTYKIRQVTIQIE